MTAPQAGEASANDAGGFIVHRQPVSLPSVEIGQYTYHARDLQFKSWAPGEKIIIGNFCSISQRVVINVGGGHDQSLVSTYPFDYFVLQRPKPHRTYRTTPHTVIGSDVWIGAGATVLSGVRVADGAVVGACAVVSSDVAPYAVVVGNPARQIKTRFSSETIAALLRIQWWNWPIEWIRERVEWFYRPVEEFVRQFDSGVGAASSRIHCPHATLPAHLLQSPSVNPQPHSHS